MIRPLFLHPAVRALEWHDLRAITAWQSARALALSAPWLALSLGLAQAGHVALALPFSAVFFMAGLRQTHDGFHGKLGISPRATDAFLFLFTLLMAVPTHAVRWIHLRHHAHPLGEDDVEGMCAGMKWWGAIVAGPYFTLRMVATALRGTRGAARRWVVAELVALAALAAAAVLTDWIWLRYQLAAMALGNCLTGFVAVWMVHRGCDRDGAFARTQRSRLVNWLTLNNFYHLEHHLFPAVPSCNLPELARRLDRVWPTAALVLSGVERNAPG
jgi:fatty acid desaturase